MKANSEQKAPCFAYLEENFVNPLWIKKNV